MVDEDLTRLHVTWHDLGDRAVRSLVAGTERPGVPELVVVPGLGALGYLLPAVRACAAWTRVRLLDVPGFGDPATARAPADLAAVSAVVARWLAAVPADPVVLMGHSTGAQAALRAAVEQPDRTALLVLAGVTFDPAARRPAVLLRRTLATVVREELGELPAVLPEYLRGRRGVPVLLRSSLADRPEDAIAQVRSPVLVQRGEHDELCPADWARSLAAAAGGRALQTPGAHNVPYTHPAVLSTVLEQAVAGLAVRAAS